MNKYIISEENRVELGRYIKKKRESKNLGLNQLALKISVTSSLISKLENGLIQKISPFLLQEVAKGLGVNYITLYELAGYLKNYNPVSNVKIPDTLEGLVQVPIYDSLLAGVGREPNPQPVDFITLPKDIVEGCVIINVHGNSMEPTLQDGSRILVKLDTKLNNNDIGIVIFENEIQIKRYKISKKRVYLYSDNLQYLPREVRKGDRFCICAKILWIMNKIK